MHLLLYMRRQYSAALPPTALLRRLEHTVPPRPAGLLWWLGIRYLPCWGKVQPATSTFRARMRWGRSSGPVIWGHWQAAPATLPLAGTTVQLTIHPTLCELLAGAGFLAFITSAIILAQLPTKPADLAPLALPGVMAVFWLTGFWVDIRRAERYFRQALLLKVEAT